MAAGHVRSLTLFRWRSFVVLSALAFTAQNQRSIPLTAGMVIDRSATIRPGTYHLTASADMTRPVITIRGENITVDFNGAALVGGRREADPDTFAGLAILVDGGRGITIKNAVVRGYKVGILGRHSPELHLSRNDLSYNWKPRLYSGVEKESLVDWMSYHQNEKDEWLRQGAAIYLADCDRAEIDQNTIVQGQNGLMVTRSDGLTIWNNTIQFMSGIGVGLYRTIGSTIMHNRIDWCVRGYSHGFYNRGQDSAGLLMYEQSSRNNVAYNSITHGGDGLFLWAGQSTMDTGQGGSNDNTFEGDETAIRLWKNASQDPNWGYPKHRDTRSHGYKLVANRIIVDDWGPYDWKSPKLCPAGRSDDTPLKLRVLGPEGRWTLSRVDGATVTPREGTVPGEIVVTPTSTAPVDFRVVLEYRAANVISSRGVQTPAGKPATFEYSRFFAPIDWTVQFFGYTDASHPVKAPDAFKALVGGRSLGTLVTKRVDYLSGRNFADGIPADRFAVAAEGTTLLPDGDYILQVISDDGVRVWMDGDVILDEWHAHESRVNRVPIRGGRRHFKVEYYEATGFAELRFDIQRK